MTFYSNITTFMTWSQNISLILQTSLHKTKVAGLMMSIKTYWWHLPSIQKYLRIYQRVTCSFKSVHSPSVLVSTDFICFAPFFGTTFDVVGDSLWLEFLFALRTRKVIARISRKYFGHFELITSVGSYLLRIILSPLTVPINDLKNNNNSKN